MNGFGHRALGASAGVVWGHVAGLPLWQAAIVVPVAAAFSHGAISPDLDNTNRWRSWDRWTPDELLGHQGPMRHRGLLHWWGLHLGLSVALWTGHLTLGWLPWWVLGAVLAGWWSHLLGDFIVGARGYGRGPGIPMLPWWAHWGLGFKCGGVVEALLTVAVPAAVGWWMWGDLLHLPDTHAIMAGIGL